ncbi:MAG TPA: hypothetical protein VKX49_06245 [Bryobacteraceae bacterium]|nr:hypothetical protein [Bryobacteraceae bacterium]
MQASLCFGFSKSDWQSLTARLNNGDENAWSQAIGVFERRMRERFFSCIDALINADTKPDSRAPEARVSNDCIPGFSILALCCLLIDTLQGFREKPSHPPVPTGPCIFPTRPCIRPLTGTAEQFKSFLRRPAFGETFRDEGVAARFVNGIRNGVLHEAETRKWVIWRDKPAGQIVAPEDDGYALNRTLFYAAVNKEFDSYLQELREPSNTELRNRFKKKMDDICKEA